MKLAPEIEAIIDRHPSLHVWGLGQPRGCRIDDLDAAQAELLTPGTVHAIAKAKAWCETHLDPNRPHPRKDRSTYSWKHRYEQSLGGEYIPNGAFAVAAALAGLPISWDGYNPTVHAHESRKAPIDPGPALPPPHHPRSLPLRTRRFTGATPGHHDQEDAS